MKVQFDLEVKGFDTLRKRLAELPGELKKTPIRAALKAGGAVFEQEITVDLPANTQFLSPQLFMNNGATAAAVAYDCSGVYVETD